MPSQHLYLRMDIARLGRMVRHKWSFSLQEMLMRMNSLSHSQLSDICQSNIVEFNWHMGCTILVWATCLGSEQHVSVPKEHQEMVGVLTYCNDQREHGHVEKNMTNLT